MKHRVLKDYQHITTDKRVVQIKAKLLIEDYKVNIKGDIYKLDVDIVDNNPEFFHAIDWKQDLVDYMKSNKLPSPAILSKKLIPYIEENYLSKSKVETKIVEKVIEKVTDNTALEVELKKRQQLLDDMSTKVDQREVELSQRENYNIQAKHQNDERDRQLDLKDKELSTKKLEIQKMEKILSERESLLGSRSKSEQAYQAQLELKIQEYEDKLSQVDEQLEKYRIDKSLSLDDFKTLLMLSADKYVQTKDEVWRQLVEKTGWYFNQNGLFK